MRRLLLQYGINLVYIIIGSTHSGCIIDALDQFRVFLEHIRSFVCRYILAELSECVDFRQDENSFSDIKLIFTNTFLGYKMAQTERIECLNLLAKAAKVDLYTDDPAKDRLRNVIIRGTVSYFNDMPKVFAASKINMNFTIRNIRSGIPLRVWDVLGAGGFLLTNFQPEFLSFFENGKDIVFYDSLSDMQAKALYYLEHEDERKQIAENGHKYMDMIDVS